MQVTYSAVPPAGELHVHTNAGSGRPFAVITLGGADIRLQSEEDCDVLARAAARAREMLAKVGTPHGFTPMPGDRYRCLTCGDLDDADHWRPEPVTGRDVLLSAMADTAEDAS